MNVFYFFISIFINFSLSTAQSVEGSLNISTTTELFNGNGWKISAQTKNARHFIFQFSCSDCYFLKDWAGLCFYVYFTRYPSTVKPVQDLKNEGYFVTKATYSFRMYRKYSLKNSNNALITNNSFSMELDVIYLKDAPNLIQIIYGFSINHKLIFGNSKFPTEYHPGNKFSVIRRDCHIFANSINYFVPSLEADIFFNYTWPEFRRGVILTLIVQDVLKEIHSLDYKVVKDDDNQWTLMDYGSNWHRNIPIEVNLTLVADHLIQNPIPLSILSQDEILCGFYPRSHFSSYIFGGPVLTRDSETELELPKEDDYKTLSQISIMLTVIITFIVIFGIYAIVATYQLISWKRHYNQMALGLWNRLQHQGDNNFNNFAGSSEYANSIMQLQ